MCVCVHVSLSVPITVCLSLDYLQTTVCKLIINRNDNDEWLVKFVISGMCVCVCVFDCLKSMESIHTLKLHMTQ